MKTEKYDEYSTLAEDLQWYPGMELLPVSVIDDICIVYSEVDFTDEKYVESDKCHTAIPLQFRKLSEHHINNVTQNYKKKAESR